MEFKVKLLDIRAGEKQIIVIDDEYASRMGIHSSDRVKITYKNKKTIAIANVATNFPEKTVGIYEEVQEKLKIKENETVTIKPAERPESLGFIRKKIMGRKLRHEEIKSIIVDVVERHLSDVELASFVTSLHIRGSSIEEIEGLTKAMIETGKTINFGKTPILDKHSIGGVPGDKTTILVVPIVAAAGFTIPKTSSRAITSPAGTADRVEVLCPVDLSFEEMRVVVKKTNACLAWGGSLDLAPADDLLIQVEYPLSIDPLLLPSILSKKKAIGAEYLVIDIPTGRGAKIKTIGEAQELAQDFIELGKRLGIHIQCGVTFGEQPIGHAIGPALEAREALLALMNKGPLDLVNKASSLAGLLFEMMGIEDGLQKAKEIIESGKAEKKLREIIAVQGGDPKVQPEDIQIGKEVTEIYSKEAGTIQWINNRYIAQIAREAGAPKTKSAGVLLNKKLGDKVKAGEVLFRIYSGSKQKLNTAVRLSNRLETFGITEKFGEKMLIDRIPTEKVSFEKPFVLER
ncbi:MAG: AMP phosphorylase [Candidatus Bathyarchaeota archaeon]|nr:MAG: AMP phosphorylase [Candidatus Bathyarchaeum tardum]WNZ28530.1 MAG: AMP phosphorylase [Candidatus Bathyarchaeota archaeon]